MNSLVTPAADSVPPRWWRVGEAALVVGLVATVAWTTLCLGGYLAETMVVTSWAVFGLAALGGMLWVVRPGGAPFTLHRAVWLPVPFLLYALGSVLWLAPAQWLAWREWLLWVQMGIVFGLALHFGRGRRMTTLIVATAVMLGLVGVAMAAYQRYVDGSWMMLGRTQARYYAGRSAGMFGIPNSLAGLLVLMIPLVLAGVFARGTSVLLKIGCAWVGAVFIFGLVLTGSRGGWIALAAALMLGAILTGRGWWKKIWVAGLVLLVAVIGLVALFRLSGPARERIQPFLDGRFETTRPLLWKAGYQIWRDHPWIGSGAASYNVVFEQYCPRGFLNEPDWTHNDYLNTLSDYGVVGFGLWAGAGALLLVGAWRAVRRKDAAASRSGFIGGAGWRWGLFIGLLAFALHLGVDFHTKIPALAFAAAIGGALLLRDDARWQRPWAGMGGRLAAVGLAIAALLVAAFIAVPVYRSEAWRYEARRAIDRFAINGKGDFKTIIPAARTAFARAVEINPQNGQAWADLAYATVLGWHVTRGDLVATGREGETAARRAVALCGVTAEYWVRLGTALDMQARHREGEECFRRAVNLAPHSPGVWYHYAYHLQPFSARKAEAKAALDTCLSLDPYYGPGLAWRQQLGAPR